MTSSPSLRDQVRFVDTPGARLAVHDSATDGPPVLMLHGGPGCPDYLRPVAGLLASIHRTVTFDQRGVGGSVTLDGRFDIVPTWPTWKPCEAHSGSPAWGAACR